MPDLNRSERRALVLATILVLLGAAARLGLGPGEEAYGWRPAATGGPTAGALGEVREAVERGRARARRASTPLAPGERLDPNTAPAVELERLPGVGPVTAEAILRHRGDRPFRRRRDLLSVRGIGPATLAKIAPHVDLPERPAVGGASGGAGAAAAAGGGSGRGRMRPEGGEGRSGRLDLNRATGEELRTLPGVGPFLARQILAHRDREGGFGDVDELLEVWGIGAARLEEIRPLVVVR
jgi:competence ComEA-like helix-hairpin-helix protein